MKIFKNIPKHKIDNFNIIMAPIFNISDDPQDKLTPLELCDDIVSNIHDIKLFTGDTKVLVLCNIEFIKTVHVLYKSLNKNMDNVHFVTVCEYKKTIVKAFINSNNIHKYDSYKEFFEDNDLPKFDVVIGNPPYQNDKKGTNNKLWQEFIIKSFDVLNVDGFVSLLTPFSWASGAKHPHKSYSIFKDIIKKYQTISITSPTEIDKYFKEGIRISSFLIQKSKNLQPTLIDNNIFIDLKNYNILPITLNENMLSILDKLKSFDMIQLTHDRKAHHIYDENGIYKVWNGMYKNGHEIRNSNKCSPYINDKKVMITRTGNYSWFGDDNGEYSSNYCQIYFLQDNEKSKYFISVVESSLYKFLFKMFKHTHYNEKRYMEFFPKLDFTKEWTDIELYQHFKLTQEEIEYIEKTI